MLLVEQKATLALDLADHAYLLEAGRVVMSGTSGTSRRIPPSVAHTLVTRGIRAWKPHARVLSGLATGGIYASIALALVMIYQATNLVNFAQGEMAMFSTYIAWSLIEGGLPYWGAFAATVAIAFIIGVVIERVIIRPIARKSELAVVVVFIGSW